MYLPVLLPNESWDQGPSRYRGLDDSGIKHLLNVGLFAAKKADFRCTLFVTGATSPVSISCSRMVKFLTSNSLRANTSWNSDYKLASWDPSNRSYKWASSSGPHSATFRTSLLEFGTICANLPPRFKRCSLKSLIIKKILL